MKNNCLFYNGRELANDNIGPGVWLLYNYRVTEDVPKFMNGKEMKKQELMIEKREWKWYKYYADAGASLWQRLT